MLLILFLFNYFYLKFKSGNYSLVSCLYSIFQPISQTMIMPRHDVISIYSIIWLARNWLYMKLTSYLHIIKHSFDSVFVMDSLCKNQLEAVVIKFSQCYNILNFLREEKIQLLFFNTLYVSWSTLGKVRWIPHTILYYFFFLIGHNVNTLWQGSANYGSQANCSPLSVLLWPMS